MTKHIALNCLNCGSTLPEDLVCSYCGTYHESTSNGESQADNKTQEECGKCDNPTNWKYVKNTDKFYCKYCDKQVAISKKKVEHNYNPEIRRSFIKKINKKIKRISRRINRTIYIAATILAPIEAIIFIITAFWIFPHMSWKEIAIQIVGELVVMVAIFIVPMFLRFFFSSSLPPPTEKDNLSYFETIGSILLFILGAAFLFVLLYFFFQAFILIPGNMYFENGIEQIKTLSYFHFFLITHNFLFSLWIEGQVKQLESEKTLLEKIGKAS